MPRRQFVNWLVFSYSLPAKSSSPRVSVWRQLKRLGAISPVGGVYVLPAQEPCDEAFGWLAQQVRQAGGEALVMRVEQFEGLAASELIALFDRAREVDYAAIDERVAQLETGLEEVGGAQERLSLKEELDRLQTQYADVARIDYFESHPKVELAVRLARLRQALLADILAPVDVAPTEIDAYRDRRWVTRPHPHVDRLACAWLIRRYVNPQAAIRYAANPALDEVAFDMAGADSDRRAEFSHQGDLCTLEVMVQAFGLEETALQVVTEIVHEIDLRDGVYARPETSGVDALLRGWQLAGLADEEMEARGLALFDGLYAAFAGGARSK
jgi:hypothetical protein